MVVDVLISAPPSPLLDRIGPESGVVLEMGGVSTTPGGGEFESYSVTVDELRNIVPELVTATSSVDSVYGA